MTVSTPSSDGVFRIAAFSGYSGDRADALKDQAASSGCDILFGDYLAEMVSDDQGWPLLLS
jgi:hypothetical protein